MGTAAALTWGERRLLGFFQNRYGPNRVGPAGIFQVVADMIKILTKEDWVPPFADRPVFIIAPAILIIAVFMSFAVITFAPGIAVADLNVGLLFFLAMSSMSVYSVALAGWASNNKYLPAGQPARRRADVELRSVHGPVADGRGDAGRIPSACAPSWNSKRISGICVPQCLGLLIFFIAGLAETRRIPFDLPEAESELIAGYHTEYSGMKFAMFFLGEYIGITLISALVVTLVLRRMAGAVSPADRLVRRAKRCCVIALFILLRAALPRLRFDQLMEFGWKLMLPLALLNLVVTGAIVCDGVTPRIRTMGFEIRDERH